MSQKRKNPKAYTKRQHAAGVGYVVYVHRFGIGTLSHGERLGESMLLLGKPVTLFASRGQALRAIEQTARAGTFPRNAMTVLPVAPAKK